MEELEEKINKIPDQVRRWIVYVTVAPPVFLLVGTTLLITDVIDFGIIFWIGVLILGISSFMWWIWVLYSIIKLAKYIRNAHTGIHTAIKELEEIRSIVKYDTSYEKDE